MATASATPNLISQTAAELRGQCETLKSQVLSQIARHFLRHPQPVNKPDTSNNRQEYLALIAYPVTTREESESYIIELRGGGFTFENPQGEPAVAQYEVLAVEQLVDVVGALEEAAGGGNS